MKRGRELLKRGEPLEAVRGFLGECRNVRTARAPGKRPKFTIWTRGERGISLVRASLSGWKMAPWQARYGMLSRWSGNRWMTSARGHSETVNGRACASALISRGAAFRQNATNLSTTSAVQL